MAGFTIWIAIIVIGGMIAMTVEPEGAQSITVEVAYSPSTSSPGSQQMTLAQFVNMLTGDLGGRPSVIPSDSSN